MHATRLLTRRNIIATPKSKSFSNYRKLSFTPRYVPTTTLHTNPSLIRTQVFTREFLGHKKEVVEDKEFGKDIGDGLRVGVRSREQDNVEVYIKLRENLGNELHQAAHNMLSNSKDTVTSLVPSDSVASKVIGAVGTVVGKVVGSTETKEHKLQSRSLWIPLFGTFRLHSNEAGDNEIAFEFNKRKTKGGKLDVLIKAYLSAEQLFNPAKPESERLALAVRIVIDAFTKIPFASSLAEKLTKSVLHKLL